MPPQLRTGEAGKDHDVELAVVQRRLRGDGEARTEVGTVGHGDCQRARRQHPVVEVDDHPWRAVTNEYPDGREQGAVVAGIDPLRFAEDGGVEPDRSTL